MRSRGALRASLVLVPALLIAARCQAQVTIFFDGGGPESGVTEPGTASFSFMGSNWSGGVVRTEGIRSLYASGSFSYEVPRGPAAVHFDDPVDSVRFFYVHGFGFASGTATAFDAANTVIGMIGSRQATFLGDPGNFVTLDPEEPIARMEFTTGVIDNFRFTTVALATPTPSDRGTGTSTSTPSPTVSPTPTPPAGPLPCAGDCNGDGAVTIDELVRGVNLALDPASVSDCPSLDTDLNGVLTVDELVRAVGEALHGCGAAQRPAFLVTDINPLPSMRSSDPRDGVVVGATLFFVATTASTGAELWKTDGTRPGTALVRDIRLGAEGSEPGFLRDLDGKLLFFASDGGHGRELWTSDGTAAGTHMVIDLYPSREGSNPRSGGQHHSIDATVADRHMFFSANDGQNGDELWVTDGTVAGTRLARDIAPGSADSAPAYFGAADSLVFFNAIDGVTGRQLWRSDGTADGTVRLTDLNRGGIGANPWFVTGVGPHAFFTALDETGRGLWVSDGTLDGTRRLMRGFGVDSEAFPAPLAGVGDRLFFKVREQLWVSGGTNVRMASSIQPGAGAGLNNALVFAGRDQDGALGLWRTAPRRERNASATSFLPSGSSTASVVV